MLIKKFSHFHKTWKNRHGTAFSVLGYPRSGTTMMSEIVAMVTDYYFDRDNVYPSSSKVVLHTHWNPAWYAPERSVYMIRNPLDVCLSMLEYAAVQSWMLPEDLALKSRKISKLPWLEHCGRAKTVGHLIVDYDRFVAHDANETERLAKHLGVPKSWIDQAMTPLGEKHA